MTENGFLLIKQVAKRIDVVCNFAYPFHEGLARIQVGTLFGFINTTGAIVIKPQFEGAYDFSEGKARVRKGDKWGFIDLKGMFVIKPTL